MISLYCVYLLLPKENGGGDIPRAENAMTRTEAEKGEMYPHVRCCVAI